jgi:molybdopterin synthase catalytic subunit
VKVSLRLFASLRELAGQRELSLELPEGATVADLKCRLEKDYPALQGILDRVVFAVNDDYVPAGEPLHAGAEVAAIPPVSGGSDSQALFRVTYDELEAQRLVDLVKRPEAGAVDLFYGIVRNHNDGKAVEHLEYEAHESMALHKLQDVAAETKRRFPEISEVGAWHRIGRLEVGETSLLVAVSAPHRKASFEACLWAVDRIKKVVPVWKKEFGPDGSYWIEGVTPDIVEGSPASP